MKPSKTPELAQPVSSGAQRAYDFAFKSPPRNTLSGRASIRASCVEGQSTEGSILTCNQFRSQKIRNRLASPNETGSSSLDENFCGPQTRIVVGAQRHAVGSRVEERNKISRLHRLQKTIAREEVPGFADGSHDVDGTRFAYAGPPRNN